MIDALLLDLGNVLVFHDNALLFRRFGEVAGVDPKQLGDRFERELWLDINTGRLKGDAIRAEICRRLGVELTRERFLELWNCHFTVNHSVMPMVEALVGRVKLVLVSNTNDLHIDWVRPRVPLLSRFDALVLSHEVGFAKPHRRIFDRALRLAGAAPERAGFFDDYLEYVEAAKVLGIRAQQFAATSDFPSQLRALGL